MLRIDPTHRCGAMLVYDRRLMVMPFRAELPVSDPFESLDDFRPLPASYALDLAELGIRRIKDYVFLEVLACLLAPPRAAACRRVCACVAASLTVASHRARDRNRAISSRR